MPEDNAVINFNQDVGSSSYVFPVERKGFFD